MGKNKKNPKKNHKKYKIGRMANKNWNKGKLKLLSNNKLKKERWCQVGDDAERV
jgi:hypothetical protein